MSVKKPEMKSVAPYLMWDVDRDSMDPIGHASFIIERTLNFGTPESVRTLLDMYPQSSIVKVIQQSKNLDRKTANYWGVRFKIPREKITCMKTSSAKRSFD